MLELELELEVEVAVDIRYTIHYKLVVNCVVVGWISRCLQDT